MQRTLTKNSFFYIAYKTDSNLESPEEAMAPCQVLEINPQNVIKTPKQKLLADLVSQIALDSDKEEFLLFCKRYETYLRISHHPQLERIMQFYTFFEPSSGVANLKDNSQLNDDEEEFLKLLFQMMERCNFRMLSDAEVKAAMEGQYLLNLHVVVDESKLDDKLLSRYFGKHTANYAPNFKLVSKDKVEGSMRKAMSKIASPSNYKCAIFIQGIGFARASSFFPMTKLNIMLSRVWSRFFILIRCKEEKEEDKVLCDPDKLPEVDLRNDKRITRIHLDNIKLCLKDLFQKTTIQDATFDHIIIIYRLKNEERGIHIKQFKNIPFADMELIFPEKKKPRLNTLDWIKLLISSIAGILALIISLTTHKSGLWLGIGLCSAFFSYFLKVYFTFHTNVNKYQAVMINSMYEKQLDNGRGSLLHLFDNMIDQEVKEGVLAYFVLSKGGTTIENLGIRCKKLLRAICNETCNFDTKDAIKRLDDIGAITMEDSSKGYCYQPFKIANDKLCAIVQDCIANINTQ